MNGYAPAGRATRRFAVSTVALGAVALFALAGFRGAPGDAPSRDAALRALHLWPSASVGLALRPAAPADVLAVRAAVRPRAAREASPSAAGAASTATAPIVTATKTDNTAGPVGAGGTISYTVEIANTGADDALGVTFTDTVDPNTTLSGAVRVSPLGFPDDYGLLVGETLTVAAPGVLADDFLGSPAAAVTAFSLDDFTTTHAAGATVVVGADGSLTVNADGSFTFEPATGFGDGDTFTFDYRLANTAGFDAAEVTVTGSAPVAPTAADDGPAANSAPGDAYHTAFNTAFNLPAAGVLANDALGVPTAALASFGGGSLGGAVTDHAAGATVNFGTGGSLTVNADGSVAFTPSAGFTGLFTFDYRLTNVAGSDDGTVTIAVGTRPAAGADTYTPASGALIGNVPFDTDNVSDFSVLGNDTGDALVLSATVSAETGGTATLNTTSGTFAFDPAAGHAGAAGFSYTVGNGFGDVVGTVSFTISTTAIWFVDENQAAAGTGTLTSPFSTLGAFQGVNDGVGNHPGTSDIAFLYQSADPYTGGVTLLSGQRLIGQDATASLASLGGVTPAPDNAALPPTDGTAGGVTLSSAGSGVQLTGGGTGYHVHGLTIASSSGAALGGTNFGTLNVSAVGINNTGGPAVNLSTGALSATFTGITTSGGSPGIGLTSTSGSFQVTGATGVSGTTGTGVSLASNTATITFADLDIAPNAGQRALHATENTGTITATSGDLTASGAAVEITKAAAPATPLALVLTSVTGTGGVNNVRLQRVSGTATLGTGALSGSTGSAFLVESATANVSYGGSITNAAGHAVEVSGQSAGTVALSGAIGETGTGILLSGNTGGTVAFSGAITASTGTSAAFSATGGGTVTTTAAASTLATTTGTALNVQNTTIGAAGLTFRSISANGGANGIVLQNTGTTGGGLTVTGTGAAGTGGTIQNIVGADGAVAGNGVYLATTRNVSLSWMNLSNTQNNGVFGTGVRGGFAASNLVFSGTHGNSNSGTFDESALHLVDAGGVVTVRNSTLNGGAFNAARVENIAGTAPVLDSLVFSNNTVTTMQGSVVDVRSTAILVNLLDGSADVRIRNNTVTAWWGNAIHVLAQGTASATTRITGNTADNNNGALAGAGGIWVAGGAHTYRIANNSVRDTDGTAISADRVNFGATMQGTIENNTVGVSGVANSGSNTGIGIFASHHGPGTTTVRIANNTIRQINGSANGAITTVTGDAAAFGGSGTMNATIVGNDIQESGTTVNSAQHGILVTHGITSTAPGDSDLGCYDVGGAGALANSITNFNTASGGSNVNRIRVNQRFSTTSRWPGYTGTATGASSTTDLAAYLLGRNTASNSTNANSSTGGFLNTVPAGSACPQPAVLSFAAGPEASPADPLVGGPAELIGAVAPVTGEKAPGGAPLAGASKPVGEPAVEAEEATLAFTGPLADEPVLLASADPLEAARIAADAFRARRDARLAAEATAGAEAALEAAAPMPPDVSVAIGTLPAGKTVTILFDVTVNAPVVVTEVSNQGTVSGDNFADVLTDDPDTGTAGDATVTPVTAAPADDTGPVVSNVVATPNPVAINTAVTLTADASDDTTGGSNIASAAYTLNGGAPQPMAAADGAFDEVTEAVTAALGTFTAPAVHTLCVQATDAAGNTGDPSCILLAVYDPAAGFVTGAGRIDSPAGAYVPDPGLTGPAHFAFLSKYQTGNRPPAGHTSFRFRAADLDFNSTSFEWLVIAGARAQYKGVGTINGSGNYGFMLTAIDGAVNGGGGMDRFRIKIWDRNNGGALVYDNQVGVGCGDTSDGATPCTVIAAGNIMIHRRGGNGGNALALPAEVTLSPPIPNPSSGTATLLFGLPEAARVELVVFDALGRAVARLADGELEPGWYEVALDGARLPSGTYFARLRAGEHQVTQRVTLVR